MEELIRKKMEEQIKHYIYEEIDARDMFKLKKDIENLAEKINLDDDFVPPPPLGEPNPYFKRNANKLMAYDPFGQENEAKPIMDADMKIEPNTNWSYSIPYTQPLSKEEELESNIVRIDLEKAAKELASMEIKFYHNAHHPVDENSERFLNTYDKYYDILFKSKI